MAEDSFFRFIEILDRVFLIGGVIFLFLGFASFLIVIMSYPMGMFKDEVISFAFSFVSLFMIILGIFLILYHSKIIVKPVE